MTRRMETLLLTATLSFAGCRTGGVRIDFRAAHAYLACAESGETECAARSAATPGGQVAEAARASFGEEPADRKPEAASSAVAGLVAEMKRWPDVGAAVSDWLPEPPRESVQVYVVANGHGWGDAYTRSATSGERVAILNAERIAAGYRGGAADQAASALGVLKHEVFHVMFRRYTAAEPRWRTLEGAGAEADLAWLVVNEGVAHLVDGEAARKPDFLLKAAPALSRLSEAALALREGRGNPEEVLRGASQGKFWEKFGSVSGFLMAWAVHQQHGVQGVREVVRCGPGRLVWRYQAAEKARADLPPLPEPLLKWAEGWDLCGADSR